MEAIRKAPAEPPPAQLRHLLPLSFNTFVFRQGRKENKPAKSFPVAKPEKNGTRFPTNGFFPSDTPPCFGENIAMAGILACGFWQHIFLSGHPAIGRRSLPHTVAGAALE